MKQNKQDSGIKKGRNIIFNVGAISTGVAVIAYVILDIVISKGLTEGSKVAGVAFLIMIVSIMAAGICIASFIARQQRVLSVLCIIIAIAMQAQFVYWFSGYGSGY